MMATLLARQLPLEVVRGLTSSTDSANIVVHLVTRSEFSLKTNVVVGEFAHLSVVDTDYLGFLVAAEAQVTSGEVVHGPEDDSLHHDNDQESII